ncbi:hypothetical protein Efla_004413 [Eimeria flavescens]
MIPPLDRKWPPLLRAARLSPSLVRANEQTENLDFGVCTPRNPRKTAGKSAEMADTIESRCFPNPLAEAEASGRAAEEGSPSPLQLSVGGAPGLTPEAERTLQEALQYYSASLVRESDPEEGWCRTGCCPLERGGGESIYIGKAGIDLALLRLKLQQAEGKKGGPLEAAFRGAEWFLPDESELSEHPSKQLDCSFICGPAGGWFSLAMRALCLPSAGAEDAKPFILSFLKFARYAASHAEADEWLYGRAGFVVALLQLRQQLQQQKQQQLQELLGPLDSVLSELGEAMLASGVRTAELLNDPSGPPLRYQFAGKEFIGAAHGHFCILYALLLLPSIRENAAHPAHQQIKATLAWLLRLETEQHNYPAVYTPGSQANPPPPAHLVYFCHGAPGAVLLLAEAYEVYRDEVYRQAGERAAACTWRFGLLRKGSSLCHGVAGNGYALLRWYQLTRQPVWLERAVRFGLELNSDRQKRIKRDHPFSLFEGFAGVCCFLSDLLHDPLNAALPAFGL